MKPILAALAASVLAGCATTSTGTSAAQQDFLKAVDAASTLNNTTVSLLDSLARSGTVPAATNLKVLAITDKVQAALELATTAYKAGDQATGLAKLAAGAAAVAQLQTCIIAPATLVTCLQGVTLP
jgi:hypothetical protein